VRGELEALIADLDLEALLDHFGVDYRRTGGGSNLNLRECPFCHDDRWRAYMSVEKKLGLCFHADCQKRWNLFSFVRAKLETDARGAIRFLEDYGSQVLGRSTRASLARGQARLPTAWELPASVPLPTDDGMTHPYLVTRRILPLTQSLFGLRWCEDGIYSYEDVDGRARRMWFGGRVLHPICDLDGTVATFVGRDVGGASTVRYLFPPLLPAAGRYLYGGERLSGFAHVVLGEGPYDCLAIHQAIVDHPDFRDTAAAATFGLSIGHADPESGNDQLGRLLRLKETGLRRVTFLWDGERNALKAALEAAELVAAHTGLHVRIGLLPGGKDPAELETREVRAAIGQARPFEPRLKLLWSLKNPYD
jgi:DNA primase